MYPLSYSFKMVNCCHVGLLKVNKLVPRAVQGAVLAEHGGAPMPWKYSLSGVRDNQLIRIVRIQDRFELDMFAA